MDDNGISFQKLKRSVNIKRIQKSSLKFQIILQSTQGLLVLSPQKIHKTLFDHNFAGILAERRKSQSSRFRKGKSRHSREKSTAAFGETFLRTNQQAPQDITRPDRNPWAVHPRHGIMNHVVTMILLGFISWTEIVCFELSFEKDQRLK